MISVFCIVYTVLFFVRLLSFFLWRSSWATWVDSALSWRTSWIVCSESWQTSAPNCFRNTKSFQWDLHLLKTDRSCIELDYFLVQERLGELRKTLDEMNWKENMMQKKMADMTASAEMFEKTRVKTESSIGDTIAHSKSWARAAFLQMKCVSSF